MNNNSQDSPAIRLASRPKLDDLDWILQYTGVILPVINLILTTVALYVSTYDFRRLHINFLLLRYCILICFLLTAIGQFLVSFSCVSDGLIVPQAHNPIWFSGIRSSFLGADCLRCFYVAIFVERMIATVNSQFYEKRNKIWIPLLLTIIPIVLGAVISIFKLDTPDLQNLFNFIGLIVDIAGCFMIYGLRRYNNKLRKLNIKSNIILSQRFQLNENIRILKCLFPIITVGVFTSLFGTIFFISSWNIPSLFDYWRYSSTIYYSLYNLYCIFSVVLYAVMDPFYLKSTGSMQLQIRNINGVDIAKKMTSEEYFKSIQEQWDGPVMAGKRNKK
ncbi:hypothetical protein FO519_008937 [Halicephalobus sp. NKZ332]|nr:hypothetical protein FO519_008937 [Halicephalobus sp. NKZ332]